MVLVVKNSKPPQKPRKPPKLYLERWFENGGLFGFLGFCAGFGGLSWFLVVFLGFYGGFGGQQLETTAKTKKNHQNSIWRDGLKMVVFLVFLGFCAGFGGLSWFLVVFLGFYSGCGGLLWLLVFREFYNRFGG